MRQSPVILYRGYTIVEMLTVVAVMLVLLGIGLPSYSRFIESQRLTAAANELLAAIHLTRSEAIHRGRRVDLLAENGDWRRGWVVFVDNNDSRQPDDGDDIVFRKEALAEGITADSSLPEGGVYLAYGGSGRSRSHASATQPLFGVIRLRLGAQQRNIVVNMLGRPRVCTPAAVAGDC